MKTVQLIMMGGFAALIAAGCGGGGGGSASSEADGVESSVQENTGSFTTSCGFVDSDDAKSLSVKSTMSSETAEVGTIADVESGNPIVVNFPGGPQAIKLLGVPLVEPVRRKLAARALQGLVGKTVYVYRGAGCGVTFDSGGIGATAQVLTENGRDLAENVLASGAVNGAEGGSCGESLVKDCYQAVYEDRAVKIGGVVSNFLWKPKADSTFNNGKMVIHASPCGASVFVNGRKLPDYGEGNGRCITARDFEKTGCDYKDAVVTIIDDKTGLPLLWPNGQTEFIIPDGCVRTEFVL